MITLFRFPNTAEFPLTGAHGELTLGPDGNLWFTGSIYTNDGLGRITPTGAITFFANSYAAGASSATGITAGPDGCLWFTEGTFGAVGKISKACLPGPRITNVSSTNADGTYGPGSVLAITITFDAAVTVTGTPQLPLNSGGIATYISGSGTNTLTFTYTVAAPQNAARLDATSFMALAMNLFGATIRDASGNYAVLTLPVSPAVGSLGVNKSITITPITTIPVTLGSTPSGLSFSVTGTGCQPGAYPSPATLNWTPGASCAVAFDNPQSGGPGTQYVFTAWTDGGVTANPRNITTPPSATTYTANFKTQYQLTTAVSPGGAGTVSGAGYYDSGASAAVSATPNSNYRFLNWTGPVASASSNPATVAMSGPQSVRANFQLTTTTTVASTSGQYSDPVTLSATLGPADTAFTGNLQFQVGGLPAGSPVPVSGAGTYTTSYTIDKAAGPYPITATMTSTASLNLASDSSGSNILTVSKEDATITPSAGNPQSGTPGPLTLTGTVQEAADGSPGDISKAVVTVTLVPGAGGGASNVCSVTNSSGSLTATCSDVPANVYTAQWRITGNYYTGSGVDTSLTITVPVTIASTPSGQSFTVDGTAYTAAQTFQWAPGSSHTIATTSPQGGGGTQYVFQSWSDGGGMSHSVTTPSTAATYTASFKTQYYLTTSAATGGSISPASGFFDGGATVQVAAIANTGYFFTGFTGDLAGSTNPQGITMDRARSVTANFVALTPVTVNTTPVGRSFTVDGTLYSAAQTFQWAPGSSHTIATTSPQGGGSGTQYVFQNWSDGLAMSHSVTTPSTATTYTASFKTQYYLTTSAGTGGSISPASGYFDSGASVQVTAIANTGYVFTGFTGDLAGFTNPQGITMDRAHSVTANFQQPIATTGFVTGSGSVMDNGVAADFAFSVKYQKDGSLQGGLTYIEHRATGDVTVSTTALTSMSIAGNSAVILGQATVNGAGSYSLQATVTDNGEPGVNHDLFGLKLTGAAISFEPAAITAGNIKMH